MKDNYIPLKQEKELWANSPEQIIQRYEKYLSEMEPKLPQLFDRLPKGKLIVVPVEKFREKNAPAAHHPMLSIRLEGCTFKILLLLG